MPLKKAVSKEVRRGKSPSKPRSKSPKKPGKSKSKGGKSPKRGKKKKRKIKAPSRAPVIDPKSKTAMENAYYICHNVPDFLQIRGFPYKGTTCKGGKKKGGKKKRK